VDKLLLSGEYKKYRPASQISAQKTLKADTTLALLQKSKLIASAGQNL
jgi:hypothetical protein